MMFVTAYRASKILFNFLVSNRFAKPFLIPCNVCEVIPQTFDLAGVCYEYVDIEKSSWCLDQEKVLNKVNDYAGMLFVRTYGVEHDQEDFFRQIKAKNSSFVIIDDSCLCVPDTAEVQTFADVRLFSLGEKKQVDLGNGGFAFVNDHLMYCEAPAPINSFLKDGSWTFDLSLLEKERAKILVHKQKLNAIYHQLLPKHIQFESVYNNWRFNIFVENKQVILDALFKNQLFASSHYRPMTKSMCMCPNAFFLYDHVVNLFNDKYYTTEQAIRTCEIINQYL